MIAYGVKYRVKGEEHNRDTVVDAKNLASAKKKIGRKHGDKEGKSITIIEHQIIGYF